MNGRDARDWGGALAVSLLLHGLLLLNAGARLGAEPREPQPERTTTRVSFASAAQAAVTPPEPVVRPPDPPPVEPPKPPREPPPKPKPKPKPVPKPPARPDPRPPLPPDPQPVPPEPVTAAAAAAAPPPPPGAATAVDPGLVEKARHEYLLRLMAHIEAFKHYPRTARRRGIEGAVDVRFTLLAGGAVGEVGSDGGHTLLRDAAEAAVRGAAPMPEPPPAVDTPMEIALKMDFSLQK
jgi:protein TonB